MHGRRSSTLMAVILLAGCGEGGPSTTTGEREDCRACRDRATDVGGACEAEASACRADYDCGGLFECCGDAPDTCGTCCSKLGTPASIVLLAAWDACVVAQCPACEPLECS
jgi:hypothetical protein